MNLPKTTAINMIVGITITMKTVSLGEKIVRMATPPTIIVTWRKNSANVEVRVSWICAVSEEILEFISPTLRFEKKDIGS